LSFNEKLPKSHEGSFAKRGMLAIQAIEHQLPAPIHHSRLNHLIIGNTGICLQNERQSQDGRGNWWLVARLFSIQTGQLFLEGFVKEFMAMVT
jgi:hypothetical protein